MKSYLIGFHRKERGQDCLELIAAIEKLTDRSMRCLPSTWIIISDIDVLEIREALTSSIRKGDQLLVVELSGYAAWTGLDRECWAWLVNNF